MSKLGRLGVRGIKKRQLRKKHRKAFKIAMSTNNTYILGFVLEVLD